MNDAMMGKASDFERSTRRKPKRDHCLSDSAGRWSKSRVFTGIYLTAIRKLGAKPAA